MKTLNNLSLNVTVGAGVSISFACDELQTLSKRLGVHLEADFNGVTLLVSPETDAKTLKDSYHVELNSGDTDKFAIG